MRSHDIVKENPIGLAISEILLHTRTHTDNHTDRSLSSSYLLLFKNDPTKSLCLCLYKKIAQT